MPRHGCASASGLQRALNDLEKQEAHLGPCSAVPEGWTFIGPTRRLVDRLSPGRLMLLKPWLVHPQVSAEFVARIEDVASAEPHSLDETSTWSQ